MSVQQKLQKGRDRLNKAGNDSDLLGLALTSIHGALEDACRDWLSAPAIKQQHRIDVQNKAEANWQNILELMPKYCGWSDRDVRYVRKMNGLRNQAAHGDGFEGTRQDIEQYLSYVKKAIAKSGTFSSSASEKYNSSTGRYFPNNIAQGGKVTPFRFWIERSNQGVKISNCRGAKVISLSANNQKSGTIHFVKIFILISLCVITFIMCFGALLLGSGMMSILAILGLITLVLINKFSSSFNTNVFITLDRIYIGKKSYPTQGMYFKSTFQNISLSSQRLYKVGVVQLNKVVHFAQDLTWHEADELLKIAVNANLMIQDTRSQFTIKNKDGLIFINSCKTKLSFALEHNEKLWQSLQCRTLENNLVELTKSELEELYSKKIQAFNV